MILDDFDMFSIVFHCIPFSIMFWLQAGQEDQSTQVEGLEPSRSLQVHFHGCRTCHFLTAPAPTVPHSEMLDCQERMSLPKLKCGASAVFFCCL